MNVAFYAPLKSPTDPTPSGDRAIGRLLMTALLAAGHRVELASRFRSREPAGDRARQARLQRVGERLAGRLYRNYRRRAPARRPHLWFTYHLYYKAPDFLGPIVSSELGIPYVVAEASHAPRRARGAWAAWHAVAGRAIAAADRVVALNPDDVPGLVALLGSAERVQRLPLFVDTSQFQFPGAEVARGEIANRLGLDPREPWLLAVGMMRPGRKVECFRLLARALDGLTDERWQLIVAGDGEAAAQVRESFGSLLERTRFVGALPAVSLATVYAASDVFAWPAIGEPMGMVLLEAQAAGIPVVAGATRGVPELVRSGETGLLVAEGDEPGFRDALRTLLTQPERRRRMGAAARRHVEEHHSLPVAARRLHEILGALGG